MKIAGCLAVLIGLTMIASPALADSTLSMLNSVGALKDCGLFKLSSNTSSLASQEVFMDTRTANRIEKTYRVCLDTDSAGRFAVRQWNPDFTSSGNFPLELHSCLDVKASRIDVTLAAGTALTVVGSYCRVD